VERVRFFDNLSAYTVPSKSSGTKRHYFLTISKHIDLECPL